MKSLGFDPGAEYLDCRGQSDIVEAVLEGLPGGAYVLSLIDGTEIVGQVTLRPDFLDAVIAQARAREQDAA